MFSILGFIIIFFLIILISGLSIIGGIFRAIFGIGRRSSSTRTNSSTSHSDTRSDDNREYNTPKSSKRKKIFENDEGEYVEFEEIKEDKK